MKNTAGVLIAFALVTMHVNASTTIYLDTFDGLQSDPLNGTAPNVRHGSETWDACELDPLNVRDPRADGSMAGGGIAGEVGGSLAFSLETGKVYTFSVDMTITNPDAGSQQWAGISFSTAPVTGSIALGNNFASLLMRQNGGAQALTPNGSAAINVAAGTYGASTEVSIVLDTTTPTWTADFLINDTSIGTSSLNPALSAGTGYIAIGQAGVVFDNLSLSVIPEPATNTLLSNSVPEASTTQAMSMNWTI